MNTINPESLAGAILFAGSLCMISCQPPQEFNREETTAANVSVDAVSVENLYGDVFAIAWQTAVESGLANAAAAGGDIDSASLTTCAVATVWPQTAGEYPRTLSIDFGDGCTANDGVTRKGQLSMTVTAPLSVAGTVCTIKMTGFEINGYRLEGICLVQCMDGVSPSLKITIDEGEVVFPDETGYTLALTETLLQQEGAGSVSVTDDVYDITGTYTIHSFAGKTINASIQSPLTKRMSCKNVVAGSVQLKYNSIPTLVQYGSGNCDNQAALWVGDKEYAVVLPR